MLEINSKLIQLEWNRLEEMDFIKKIKDLQPQFSQEVLSEDGNKDLLDKIIFSESNLEKTDAKNSLITQINVKIVKSIFNDDKFNSANEKSILNTLKTGWDFTTLINEYEIYKEKKNLMDTSNMTYEEIIAIEWDRDKIEYENDMNKIIKILKCNKNIWLWGNKGNGKTTFAKEIAARLGMKLHIAPKIDTKSDIYGRRDLQGNYYKSPIEEWEEEGGVLLHDEIAGSNAPATTDLNDIYEVNASLVKQDNGRKLVEKNPNCYIVACDNTDGSGKTVDYMGRKTQDTAFVDRFVRIHFKEYAYIHRQIIGNDRVYKKIKKYVENRGEELTCRTCVKFKDMLKEFELTEIIEMLDNGFIKL